MWYLLCLGTLHICNLRMRSFRTPSFKVQRNFEVILYLIMVRIGARYETLLLKLTQMHPIWRWPINVRILRVFERRRC